MKLDSLISKAEFGVRRQRRQRRRLEFLGFNHQRIQSEVALRLPSHSKTARGVVKAWSITLHSTK